MKKVSILLIISIFVPALWAHAQYDPGTFTTQDPLTLSISPQYPRPGQTVTVTVSGFGVDIARSAILWTLNGRTALSGIGESKFEVTVGNAGKTTIGVAVTESGKTYTKTAVITPAQEVDVIWEAKSYTPAFYKGKAMFPYQGEVIVEAVPHFFQGGRRINPKTLVYQWKSDEELIKGSSGYGKNSVTLQPNGININALNISVTVSTLDNSIIGTGRVVINTQLPSGVFYVNSPLYGTLYNQSLPQNFQLRDAEIVVEHAPYHFSSANNVHTTRSVSFTWSINGKAVTAESSAGNRIVLKKPENVAGRSQVSVQTKSLERLLQYSSGSLSISFGQNR